MRKPLVSLEKLLVAAAGLVLLTFILSTIILHTEFRENQRLRDELSQSYETRIALERVLALHVDMETAQRGFVLTGDRDFLTPHAEAERRIDSTFAALEEVLDPTSPLREAFEALDAHSTAKRRFIADVIALAHAGQQNEAIEHISSGRGKEMMDEIRQLVAQMKEQESASLARRRDSAEQSRQRLRSVVLAANAALSLLLLMATLFALKANRARHLATKQLRDVAAKQDATFESAPDGLILIDESGGIAQLNRCAAAMFGHDPEDLKQQRVTELFVDAPSAERVQAFLQALEAGQPEALGPRELEGIRQDGTRFPVEVNVRAVAGLDQLCYLAIVRDITQRKQIERLKNEFISVVSHELRTPLTSIAGSLGLLAGGAAGQLPQRAAKLIGIAHSNSTRLVRLVNDILDIEKLQAGMLRVDRVPVELGPLIEQTIRENQAFADQFGVIIETCPIPAGASVIGDADRLVQVLTNLLSNAIKFSPAGDTVHVGVTQRPETYRISVADNGPGIPHEFRDQIFQKFTQADSSDTRQKGGTGLGLTIVLEIVSLLNGRLSFESEPGQGTIFQIDLPRADIPTMEDRRGESEEERPSPFPGG